MKKGFFLIPVAIVLLLIGLLSYFVIKSNADQKVTSNKAPTFPVSTDTIPTPTEYLNESKSKKLFKNSQIEFEYPLNWILNHERQLEEPYILNIDFIGECNSYREISFLYKKTDLNEPNSFELGQLNPHGPEDQTSDVQIINEIKMGVNNQPIGDGSGGYEPKTVVDFLSDSKEYHYYFIAFKGCQDSHDKTYNRLLLPILQSVNLFE